MNEKKKILIVSNFFYPAITPRAFRTTELAKEFARKGHDVTVYIPKNNYDYTDFEKTHNVIIKDIGKPSLIDVANSKNWLISMVIRGFKKVLSYFFHHPQIELTWKIPIALKKEEYFDLLISIAYPYTIHWGCVIAKKRNERLTKRWVADCGDPFMGYRSRFGYAFYFKFIDNWFMNRVNFISIPYADLKQYYNKKHHKKILIIPQGFDLSEVKLDKYQRNNVPTFAYAGLFIENFRDPRLFLDYLSTLKSEFKFVVYTNNSKLVESYCIKLGSKLVIKEYIPRIELIRELSKMDFLINIQNGNKVDYPSKLIDYTLTQRPILNINSFHIDYQTITDFLNADYQKRLVLNNLEKFNITNVVNQFLELS